MESINFIIKSLFQFHLLSSKFEDWIYKEVKKGDSLIILRELDLTNTAPAAVAACVDVTATHAGALEVAAATTAAGAAAAATAGAARARRRQLHHRVRAVAAGAYWKIYDQAKEEFEKTDKISGYEVLNLRSLDKLWFSHYETEILTKNDI